jgi:hypothetical protein
MTEHTHSRAQHSPSELDKIRANLQGVRRPNASGATGDILPGSTESLGKRITPPVLTPEQEAAAAHNRANREKILRATLEAQRKADAPDPVNGEVDPLDAPKVDVDSLLD